MAVETVLFPFADVFFCDDPTTMQRGGGCTVSKKGATATRPNTQRTGGIPARPLVDPDSGILVSNGDRHRVEDIFSMHFLQIYLRREQDKHFCRTTL
jgi:hypothetical protein